MAPTKFVTFSCLATSFYCQAQPTPVQKPNILWIVSEDNSAYFTGCYGNSFATTPNIDKLAGQGFLYNRAYCPNAVCAPSRNCILTGVYACSNGNENMRSLFAKPEKVLTYPEYLRKAGYYCTNNFKTDYNTSSFKYESIWDDCSKSAHYKNRPKGKPFFSVFNIELSHEGRNHRQTPVDQLRHDPKKVFLPPYSPDIPEMRHDWAQYYDKVEDMDAMVGNLLKELDQSGEAENTIVMYYGDNGGVLPRSKRFVYETGTRIPFIVRIPENFTYLYPAERPGLKVDRIINFVDFTPTLLSIIGTPIPDYIQGNAFLGNQKTKDPEYTFMSRQRMDERYDLVRAVRDKRFRYIRNYMPFRITMQHVEYLFKAPSAEAWLTAFKEGKTNAVQSFPFQTKPVEELYDSEIDPWEVNNLASDPAYAPDLKRLRKVQTDWMRKIKDVGLIPETDYSDFAGDKSMYDYMRSPACPFDELMEASDLATMGGKKDINDFVRYLKSPNSAIRYWGVTGLLIIKNDARPALAALKNAAKDKSGAVATMAAEALYGLGEKKLAIETYMRILSPETYNVYSMIFALNSIDAINDSSAELITPLQQKFVELSKYMGPEKNYIAQNVNYLLIKWGILK
jgi:N-sulfoglucosamine sulfohydrolase